VISVLTLFTMIAASRPPASKGVSRDAVIKGGPRDARCKFRYIEFYSSTARLSLSADCNEPSGKKWQVLERTSQIAYLTQIWPHPYSTLILATFPLDQITHIGISLSRYTVTLFSR